MLPINETPSRSQVRLQVVCFSVSGKAKGERKKTLRFQKQKIVIGSVVSADVRLTGEGMSPIHAVVESTESGAVIYDIASVTGVTVNGKKTITSAIKTGDIVAIGGQELKISIEDPGSVTKDKDSGVFVKRGDDRNLFLDPSEDFSPLLLESDWYREEIFDYRPTSKRALEVVFSWHGTILDVQHFSDAPSVILGSDRHSDFGIPSILPSSHHPLASFEGGGWVLNLAPKMSGVLQRKSELLNLEEVKRRAPQGTNGAQVPFHEEDFAKISIGEMEFYVSFTAAPPRLKMRRILDRDPLLVKIATASLALTAMTTAALWNIKVPEKIEAEELPDRIATILYQPEKFTAFRRPKPQVTEDQKAAPPKVEPKPKPTVKLDITPSKKNLDKPIPKEMNVAETKKSAPAPQGAKTPLARTQSEGREGEGARAKGVEGTRGSKKAAPGATHQQAAKRPSPQGGTGSGGAESQVPSEGNVQMLKGASEKILNLLGSSAAKLGSGGEKLMGFGGFTTQGSGGLALEGEGAGGGGTAESLGGLSNKGIGGGRVGTGLGAAGRGGDLVGGQARQVKIRTGGPEEAVVMGAIDADAVEAALLAHRDEFRLCYEREINAENPDLAGRVGTTFVIGSGGQVTQAGVESSTLKNANAEKCIVGVIRRIDFPIPRGAGVVQVRYPFKFSSGAK